MEMGVMMRRMKSVCLLPKERLLWQQEWMTVSEKPTRQCPLAPQNHKSDPPPRLKQPWHDHQKTVTMTMTIAMTMTLMTTMT